MTAVMDDRRRVDRSRRDSAGREERPGAPRRLVQRPGMTFAGVGLVALGAVISASLVLRAHATTQVLVLARPVTAGQTLTVADLTDASIAGSGVSAIAVAAEPSVVGRQVTAGLAAGTLLAPGMLTSATGPAAGEAAVAVAVKPGLVPAGLAPGDAVSVITAHAVGATGTVLVTRAPVTAMAIDPQTGNTTVTVLVPQGDAPAVAAASANGTAVPVTVSGSR